MGTLLMPPAVCFLVGGIGWLLRKRKLGRALIGAAVALLVLFSLPACSALLLGSLQSYPALRGFDSRCRAVVVLAGDAYRDAPEYGGPTCGPLTLERLRYAAKLARETHLPLCVSGGPPRPGATPHARMMESTLENELAVDVRWVEPWSVNTRENARLASDMLRRDGVECAYLVTHAWHMPRAVAEFRSRAFEVVPAPTAFRGPATFELGSLTPSAKALHESAWALHEWLGRAWYALSR